MESGAGKGSEESASAAADKEEGESVNSVEQQTPRQNVPLRSPSRTRKRQLQWKKRRLRWRNGRLTLMKPRMRLKRRQTSRSRSVLTEYFEEEDEEEDDNQLRRLLAIADISDRFFMSPYGELVFQLQNPDDSAAAVVARAREEKLEIRASPERLQMALKLSKKERGWICEIWGFFCSIFIIARVRERFVGKYVICGFWLLAPFEENGLLLLGCYLLFFGGLDSNRVEK